MALDLRIGGELPAFWRRTDFENWNRFAAVNDEFVAIHMDDGAGQAAGFPGAIGMGNLQLSYMHMLLREWIGGRGEIREVALRFRDPNLRGQVLHVGGRIAAIEERADETEVEVELRVESDAGVQTAMGSALVVISASPEP